MNINLIPFAIVIKDHRISEKGYARLLESSKGVDNDFTINRVNAITEHNAEEVLKDTGLEWNWPHKGSVQDHTTGLIKRPYGTRVPNRRVACSLSHYLLWVMCAESDIDILVLEHDAMFTKKLDISLLKDSDFDIIGLNDPANATRLPNKFDEIVKKSKDPIIPVPRIDVETTAQGLAGNSAYYMKPDGAKHMIDACRKFGLWPNDAIMCYQMIDKLGVTTEYYTRVQGLPSTTSG